MLYFHSNHLSVVSRRSRQQHQNHHFCNFSIHKFIVLEFEYHFTIPSSYLREKNPLIHVDGNLNGRAAQFTSQQLMLKGDNLLSLRFILFSHNSTHSDMLDIQPLFLVRNVQRSAKLFVPA